MNGADDEVEDRKASHRLELGPRVFLVGYRVHRALRGWLNLGLAAARSVWVGLWLGLLPRRQVWSLGDHYYRSEPRYRDRAHNLGGLVDWERRAVERHFAGCRRLLVTAAGGGREVLALTGMGFEVVAEECNQALVEIANGLLEEAGRSASVRQSSPDALVATGGAPMDGVIVGWGAYTHIQGRSSRVAYLRQLRRVVREGAPILLSFFERPERAPMMRLVRSTAGIVRTVVGGRPAELGDVLDPHFQHYFRPDELEAELLSADFALVDYSNDGYAHAVGRAIEVSGSPGAAADRS
jgi:hypothetical protein